MKPRSGVNCKNHWGSCAARAVVHHCVWIFVHPCCLHRKGNMETPQGNDVSENNIVAGHERSGYAHVGLLVRGYRALVQKRKTWWGQEGGTNCS